MRLDLGSNACQLYDPAVHSGGTRTRAFATWYYSRTGFVIVLCQRHLDLWLDNADAEPELEPSELVFR